MAERKGSLTRLRMTREDIEAIIRAGNADAGSLANAIIAFLLGDSPATVWGEKSPGHERRLARILEVFPQAKIIHIYRDPRDVVASIQRVWGEGRRTFRVARFCRNVLRRRLQSERTLGPERHLSVRYESLVADPEGELRRVCGFLGLPFDEAIMRHHERRGTSVESVPEARDWKWLPDRPVNTSRLGRYRELLAPADIRTIESVIGPALMRAHGYEPTSLDHWRWANWASSWLVDQWLRVRGEVSRAPRANNAGGDGRKIHARQTTESSNV